MSILFSMCNNCHIKCSSFLHRFIHRACFLNADSSAEHACSVSAVCTVKEPMAEVQHRLMEVLRGVTLAQLFGHDLPRPSAATALPVLGGCCSATAPV